MKNNLSKKSAAKTAKTEAAPKKAARKTTTAKVAKTATNAKSPAPAKQSPATKQPKPAAKATKAAGTNTAATGAPTTATTTKPAAKAQKAAATDKKIQPVTTFVAQTDIGWGNSLYLRGEGAPELSWERGILMKWQDGSWVYSTTGAKTPVAFKFLINDHIWAHGHNQRVEPGATSISTPHFHH